MLANKVMNYLRRTCRAQTCFARRNGTQPTGPLSVRNREHRTLVCINKQMRCGATALMEHTTGRWWGERSFACDCATIRCKSRWGTLACLNYVGAILVRINPLTLGSCVFVVVATCTKGGLHSLCHLSIAMPLAIAPINKSKYLICSTFLFQLRLYTYLCLLFIWYFNTFHCSYGASYDLASRRKNATRESTATLKAWLSEHKKNPYPTKGEKIMLAIITKMTLTQVSTWFANARRRLKKDNKMTWEPKNRTEDEDEDALASDDEKPRHSEDMSMSSVGCVEHRRPHGMEYPGGAINVTIGNNTTVAGNAAPGAATAATAATTAAGALESGVGATIAAATATAAASAATNQHSHMGGTSVGAVGAIQPAKGKLPLVKQTAQDRPQFGNAKAQHEATLVGAVVPCAAAAQQHCLVGTGMWVA